MPAKYIRGTPEERFWAKVEVTAGCWLWLAGLNAYGYGRFQIHTGQSMLAHHFLVGPPPAGFEYDHICHNTDPSCMAGNMCVHRRCVRPDHLELVTPTENKHRRGPRMTHCKYGHEYTPDNIYWQHDGGTLRRRCRACDLARPNRYKPRPKRS